MARDLFEEAGISLQKPAKPRMEMKAKQPIEETPATMNENIARQGARSMELNAPPTSVMDAKFPAWQKSQDQADALDAISGVLMPLVGGIVAPGASMMRKGAQSMMQRAMKPTTKDLLQGKAERAADTLLREGINVTPGGMDKLRGLGMAQNEVVSDAIANSGATVSTDKVLSRLSPLAYEKSFQSNADDALAAIKKSGDEFLSNPHITGKNQIPVQTAQSIKQGTQQAVKDNYGEMADASREAQKALARGLKEEIELSVPAVKDANAKASEIWNALNVAERRALLSRNNNLLGLAPLADNSAYQSLFLLDRSPLVQSLIARGLYGAQRVPGTVAGGILGGLMQPEQR